MKTRTGFFSGVLLCASLLMSAQKTDSLHYVGIQQFNFTFAEKGPGLGLTLVNGVRFHRFFAGLGADYHLDNRFYYVSQSNSALYLDGRYYLCRSKNFFVKLDGGVNLITSPIQGWDSPQFDKKPGYYWGTGLGFKARISKEIHYLFDVSYVVRQSRYNLSYEDWRIPNQWVTDKYDNRKPMIVVSMGLEVF